MMNTKKTLCFFCACDRHKNEVLSFRHNKVLKEGGWNTIMLVNDDEPETMIDGLRIIGTGHKQPRGYFKRILIAPFQSYKALNKIDADVYQTWFMEYLPVCLLLKLKRKKIVFHLREPHPYTFLHKSLLPRWLTRFIISIIIVFMRFTLKRFDYVIAVTDSIANYLRKWGVRKVFVMGNYPMVNHNYELTLDNYLSRDNRVLYFGYIYSISCQQYMLDALQQVRNVKYLVAGKFGSNKYKELITKHPKWSEIEFVDGFKHDELPSFFNSSTISNVLRDFSKTESPNGSTGIIKIFESMEAGLPLICSDVPVYRQIWEEYKFGILVDPKNSDQIAEAINYLVQNKEEAYKMGQEGRRAVIEKYNFDITSKEYLEIINSLLT